MSRHLSLALIAFLVAGCTSGSSAPPSNGPDSIGLAAARVPRATLSPDGAIAAATSLDAFGLALYRELGSKGENLVMSPASVGLALAMARAGAAGETAKQMDSVLHFSANAGANLNALDQTLASRNGTFKDGEGKDVTVALHVANAPFAQRGVTWQAPFLDALASQFGAGLRLVDYQKDSEAARRLINGWVGQQTEGKIPDLLGPGVLDSSTRLTLVNAVYLNAPWAVPFVADATVPAPFTRLDGSSVEVPTMELGHAFRSATGNGWRAVEIPYVGGALAMDIIVPDDFRAFEQALSQDRFATIVGALEERPVNLHLPRFKVRTQADLVDALAGLGMPIAFDAEKADFTGMTTQEHLFISAVVHEATIDVDERGTEASAATAVVMAASGAALEPIDFHVDRPFVFALRDVPSGAILFIGQVVDPTAGR